MCTIYYCVLDVGTIASVSVHDKLIMKFNYEVKERDE